MRPLTTLHLPSVTGYHIFNYPLYRSIEQSVIESKANHLVTKTGENVMFGDSDILRLVVLHFKKEVLNAINVNFSVKMNRYKRYCVNQSGDDGSEIGPVYRVSFRVQRGDGVGSFCRGLFRFVKPLLYSGQRL